jgi:hypothetical protein
MVSHEHIGVNSTITMAGGVFKYCQVPVPIIIIEEASLSVVSTLRDMLWDVREIEALWSWHRLLASKIYTNHVKTLATRKIVNS